MADGCPDGMYRDQETGLCKKSIRIKRKGIYGKGFLSEPQPEQYAKIRKEETVEPPKLVDEQMAAENSFTYRNSRLHPAAQADLKYAEGLNPARKKTGGDKKSMTEDPKEARERIAYKHELKRKGISYNNEESTASLKAKVPNVREAYESEHKRSGIDYKESESNEDLRNKLRDSDKFRPLGSADERIGAPKIGGHIGGDREMPGTCRDGEEFVEGYKKADGTEVAGYCRKAHNNDSREDREKFSQNGKKTKDWEDRR